MTTPDKPLSSSSLQHTAEATQISMKKELQRKLIHLSSMGIPIIYMLTSREVMLWLLVPATLLGLLIEVLRVRSDKVEQMILKTFGPMLRPHETRGGRARMSGATWVLLSATICVLIFPEVITVTAFIVLIVSDTSAALIGRNWGRHRFLEKSVEGSSAFVVSAILVVIGVSAIYDAPTEFIAIGIVASIVAAVAEALSHGANIDDNLSIPLSFGAVMWGGLALIGGPAIDALLAL